MRVNTYFSSAVGWLAHSMPKSHSKVQASVCLIRKPASQRASEFARARPNVSLFTKLFFFLFFSGFSPSFNQSAQFFKWTEDSEGVKETDRWEKGRYTTYRKQKWCSRTLCTRSRAHTPLMKPRKKLQLNVYIFKSHSIRRIWMFSDSISSVFRRSAHSVYETYSCLLLLRRRTSHSQVGNDFQSTSKTTRCAYVWVIARSRRISLCFASSFYSSSSSSRGGERRKKNYPSFVYAQSIWTWRATNAMLSLRHWWAMLKTSRSAKMTY